MIPYAFIGLWEGWHYCAVFHLSRPGLVPIIRDKWGSTVYICGQITEKQEGQLTLPLKGFQFFESDWAEVETDLASTILVDTQKSI